MSPVPAPPPRVAPGRVRADVVVLGAGIAGLYAAVCLPDDLDVVVVDKGGPGAAGVGTGARLGSGSSPWAQGGLAAAIGADDHPDLHALDTIAASDGLSDPAAVEVLTREAPGHVARLEALGARFDRLAGRAGAPYDLAREGGQRVARSVRRADATGAEVVRALRDAVAPRVTRLPGIARALAKDADGRVDGVWVVDDDGLVAVEARAVVLATGGCGGLFAATTNPDDATGDGLALALAAGAAVRDVEFVQFHPTGLAVGGAWRFLLTEALRGAGASLHDAHGERFLLGVHPDAELAPRHVVAKAILATSEGTAWLDATGLGQARLAAEFPTVLRGAREHGFDLAAQRVPVTPAAHYQVGGVRTDLGARTSLPGLYAVGEVASSGVHGANRMAGNSLSESLVFAARAARTIVEELPATHGELRTPPAVRSSSSDAPDAAELAELRSTLRARMLEDAGPVRRADGLARMAAQLEQLRAVLPLPGADRGEVEFVHAVRAATAIVASAQLRPESRGGHWREDHPDTDPAWERVHLEVVAPTGSDA